MNEWTGAIRPVAPASLPGGWWCFRVVSGWLVGGGVCGSAVVGVGVLSVGPGLVSDGPVVWCRCAEAGVVVKGLSPAGGGGPWWGSRVPAGDGVWSGGFLLSRTLPRAVPSALEGLTSGFGMGPGVSLPPWPPAQHVTPGRPRVKGVLSVCPEQHSGREHQQSRARVAPLCGGAGVCGKPLGRLGSVSSTPRGASTSDPSTRWSAGGLTSTRLGNPHLEACFPLRCFQRLSLPNVANQPCSWRNNWHTRGWSVPVLSY